MKVFVHVFGGFCSKNMCWQCKALSCRAEKAAEQQLQAQVAVSISADVTKVLAAINSSHAQFLLT